MDKFRMKRSSVFLMFAIMSALLFSSCTGHVRHNSCQKDDDFYRVVMIAKNDKSNWSAIRYHKITGESWKIRSGAWRKIIDEENIENGRFEVSMVPFSSKNWGAVRINIITGKSWKLNRDKWVRILDEK